MKCISVAQIQFNKIKIFSKHSLLFFWGNISMHSIWNFFCGYFYYLRLKKLFSSCIGSSIYVCTYIYEYVSTSASYITSKKKKSSKSHKNILSCGMQNIHTNKTLSNMDYVYSHVCICLILNFRPKRIWLPSLLTIIVHIYFLKLEKAFLNTLKLRLWRLWLVSEDMYLHTYVCINMYT